MKKTVVLIGLFALNAFSLQSSIVPFGVTGLSDVEGEEEQVALDSFTEAYSAVSLLEDDAVQEEVLFSSIKTAIGKFYELTGRHLKSNFQERNAESLAIDDKLLGVMRKYPYQGIVADTQSLLRSVKDFNDSCDPFCGDSITFMTTFSEKMEIMRGKTFAVRTKARALRAKKAKRRAARKAKKDKTAEI